jgi:hypothetical protein
MSSKTFRKADGHNRTRTPRFEAIQPLLIRSRRLCECMAVISVHLSHSRPQIFWACLCIEFDSESLSIHMSVIRSGASRMYVSHEIRMPLKLLRPRISSDVFDVPVPCWYRVCSLTEYGITREPSERSRAGSDRFRRQAIGVTH